MNPWNALIIDPDERSRSHLQQIVNAEDRFAKVKACPDLYRAIQVLKEDSPYDLIFISHDIKSEERNLFLENAKNLPGGLAAAVIQVAEVKDADIIVEEAMNFLSGADATLFAPFSVEDLVSVTESALAAKEAEVTERQKEAMLRIIRNLMTNIDDTASRLAEIAPIARSLDQLEQSSRPVRELPGGLHDLYFDTLLEVSKESKIPEKVRPGAKYKSPNLKKKNHQKLEEFFN